MVHHPHNLTLPTGASISDQHRKKNNLSFKTFCKVYTSILKWCKLKKSSSSSLTPPPPPSSSSSKKSHSSSGKAKSRATRESNKEVGEEIEKEETMNNCRVQRDIHTRSGGFYKHKNANHCFPNVSAPLSRTGSRRSTSPSPSFMYRSMSRGSIDSSYGFSSSLSRNASKRSTTPIMFSNSTGLMKPPPVQKYLECSLDDLSRGCKKKIKVTRDVVTNTGQIVEEEEILTIDIKPGWKKGTKITFQGMGNERPGTSPADITFVIAEKRHPLFRREGDDLEIAVEIPLVKALTGCDISIPLLGGETTTLMIDDIIYPGFEKIIKGQGMPKSKEQGKRGNLKVVFLVEFPKELTEEQRSDVLSILDDSC